jgi:O-antigen/teichoic acid export membrane protein
MDVGIMSFMTNDFEVGWYGVASNIAGLAMLLSPIIASVFLPLASRAAARSDEEVAMLSRRAMHVILTIAIPVTLGLALGADFLVRVMFGAEFAPATASLRVLAPIFVLTYVAMITSLLLLTLGRGWTLTKIALSSLVITPILHLLFIPWGLATWGRGGAGIGAAIAMVLCESYMAGLMAWMVRRYLFDRAGLVALGKMLAVALLVVVLHLVLAPIGPWRLLVDAATYTTGVLWWGAVDLRALINLLRQRSPINAEGS